MSKQEMTCIICPVGCHLVIDEETHEVDGNKCKRGISYAVEEITNPIRMLTSTVKVQSALTNRLSVRTSRAIPKAKLFDVMRELDKVQVEAPINVNDVVIKNIFDTGADIVATRTIEA